MMQRKLISACFLLFLIVEIPVFSFNPSDDNPDWLMIEKGKQAVIDRELGDALRIFRTVIGNANEEGRVVPEAEMWLGYIFEQEGETDLATEQYNRALENSDLLYVKEDKYTILYRMAGIYESVYQYGKYEMLLKRIISEGSGEESEAGSALVYQQEAMFNVLVRDGIDKLFTLYRKDERKLQQAYSRLGLYHYRTGFYREAVRNYIASLITPVTNVVSYIRKKDFTYEYPDLSGFLNDAAAVDFTSDYLIEVEFEKDLYYLAASLHAMGNTGKAKEIWTALVRNGSEENWRERSNSQLIEPYIEPLLVPGRYE